MNLGETNELLDHVNDGHEYNVRLLIESSVNLEDVTCYGDTALIIAAKNGYVNIVKMLLAKGVDPNAVNKQSYNSLCFAAFYGYIDIAILLLEAGADPHYVNRNGNSALSLATLYGHFEIVKLLLERGANPGNIDVLGYTPLMLASSCDFENIVCLLLETGRSIPTHVDKDGETASSFTSHKIKKLIRRRIIFDIFQDRRYKMFKVVRHWMKFENLYSPSSNQMFYHMGVHLRRIQSYDMLKEEVPHATVQNHMFYIKGCMS